MVWKRKQARGLRGFGSLEQDFLDAQRSFDEIDDPVVLYQHIHQFAREYQGKPSETPPEVIRRLVTLYQLLVEHLREQSVDESHPLVMVEAIAALRWFRQENGGLSITLAEATLFKSCYERIGGEGASMRAKDFVLDRYDDLLA